MKKSAHRSQPTGHRRRPRFFKILLSTVNCQLSAAVILVLGLLAGCVPVGYELRDSHVKDTGVQATGEEALQNAQAFLNTRPDWKIDCSHFVLACYHSPAMNKFFAKYGYLGHNLTKDIRIYLEQKHTRRIHAADIQPGDIIIFNKTYDRIHSGHIDDADTDTHCAIVESFKDWVVTYIDASEGRKPPRIHRRKFSFYDSGPNEHVAVDPATGRRIRARETFFGAFGPPPP